MSAETVILLKYDDNTSQSARLWEIIAGQELSSKLILMPNW